MIAVGRATACVFCGDFSVTIMGKIRALSSLRRAYVNWPQIVLLYAMRRRPGIVELRMKSRQKWSLERRGACIAPIESGKKEEIVVQFFNNLWIRLLEVKKTER